jgi:MSHA biogenesis protein MshL
MSSRLPNRSAATGTLLTLALLAGCASTGEPERTGEATRDEGSTLDRIRAELDDGMEANRARGVEDPDDLEDALMPDIAPAMPAAEADEMRFDLAVDELPARPFFMSLVEGSPYNMLVHPDVDGTLSLELKDVTVPEVMRLVRRVYGYEYERDGSSYIVTPARMQSRIFHVDYLNVRRDGESRTSVSSGEATSIAEDSSSGDGATRSRSRQRTSVRPSSRIETTSETDFWASLQNTLDTMVGTDDGRNIMVDPHAGLVVVRAMPGELRDVREYLATAQENLQRQVILEAKILEVQLSSAFQTGVNWAALGSGSDGDVAGLQTSVRQGQSTVLTPDGAFDPSSVTGTSNESAFDFGGLFAIGARTDDFAALIRLLDTQGDVEVLSSPRVSTINNQKAVIKVGSDEFFVTDIRSDRTTGVGVGTERGVDVELTPFFSGISLDVTPQISRDGDVTLHVHPAVSEVIDQTKNLTIAGEQQTLPLAFSTMRESDSVVRAQNGQVVVIGGLMQDESQRNRAQTGFLGDIPILGNLFRQRAGESRQTELVILLRPLIAENSGDWSDAMQGMSDRLREREE